MKKKRREIIAKFLETIECYPELREGVLRRYRLLKEKTTDSIFPSFVRLVEKLKQAQMSFIIILRTFGNDLKEVSDEIFKQTGLVISKRGAFKKGELHADERVMRTARDVFKFFSESKVHLAIQDDFKYWNDHGEREEFGKKFVFDHSPSHLSLFFDDNLDEGIVGSYTPDGNAVPTAQLRGALLFQVHPGEAVLDENYYVKLVNQALKQRGFDHLSIGESALVWQNR